MSDTTTQQAAPMSEGGPGPADTTERTPTAPPTSPAPPDAAPQGEDAAATIARLEQQLAAARRDAGKSRVTAKQAAADGARAELAQQIGRALGIVQDDTVPDPAALTQQLAAEQQQARQAAVELAVYRAAGTAGADPDAVLDSRQFAAIAADLDPADTSAVQAAITDAIKSNPRLAAVPAGPARSGGEFPGAPAAPQRPATLRDAIASRLGA
ncbi:hypothetical protein ACFU7T_25475 [Streptomyces sp. NPDC057555]|uniref:hypothetical protein n=1 Tax=Streptomyces sp. NPDC057555 TaxID=3346166 RepID=UPI0036981CC0